MNERTSLRGGISNNMDPRIKVGLCSESVAVVIWEIDETEGNSQIASGQEKHVLMPLFCLTL